MTEADDRKSRSRPIQDVEGLVGERVARVVELGSSIGIVFESGNWCVIEPMSDYDGDMDVDLAEDADIHERLAMGLVSEADYEAERARVREEREAEAAESDRRDYERLKAKFEEGP